MAHMAKREVGGADFVGGLAKGLAVIESFDAGRAEMTLSEVARRAGITPAAARRSLHTLKALGYVRQVEKRFLLSTRVLLLGAAYLRAAHVEELLLPELRRLVGRFGDAASVSVLEGGDILYVAHHSEQRANRIFAGVGVTYPAYPTSMGRVLLAGLPPHAFDAYLGQARLERLTDHTVTDRAALRDIIARVRADGYATACDELDYGIAALAVPIRDAAGNVLAALNSSGYSGRVKVADMIAERLSELRESAARMSQALARHPALARSLAANAIEWPLRAAE
jgi:IclR family pca regulon transcriptional regulator